MRKIDEMMLNAVKEHRNWKNGNTEVKVYKIGGFMHIRVYLHDNLIWKWNEAEDIAEFTLAGWNTMVTRNRLNALGVDVYGRVCSGFGCADDMWPMYNGQTIDPDKWYECKMVK